MICELTADTEFMSEVIGDDIDLQAILDGGDVAIVQCKPYGGFLVKSLSPTSCCVHTTFKRKTPRKVLTEAIADGLSLLFMAAEMTEVFSHACSSNPPAKRLMQTTGFRTLWTRPSGEHTEQFGVITLDEYILRSEECKKEGESFHKLVEDTTDHGEDEVHDRYVGAAVILIKMGNYDKAQLVYNKWAVLAGYAPLVIDLENKIVIAGPMTIQLNEDMTEVEGVTCQQRP